MENIRIDCQMDVGEFEGLFYNILSEGSFKSQIFHTTEETDDYTISDYVSQNRGRKTISTDMFFILENININ